MLTVILGLIIHGKQTFFILWFLETQNKFKLNNKKAFVVLPGLYILVTRKNILKFTKNMFDALFIAVATASSTAALPTTFTCIEEKNKINKLISRFVLPVGATSNLCQTVNNY